MNTNEVRLNFITRNVVRHFKFLFDKGFNVSNASGFFDSFGNWFVKFESSKCFLTVLSDRDEVTIRIYPIKADRKIVIGLKSIIFYLSKGQTFIGNYQGNLLWGTRKQLEQASKLLEEYIDQIIPYMGNEFQRIADDYKLASEKYLELQISTFRGRGY